MSSASTTSTILSPHPDPRILPSSNDSTDQLNFELNDLSLKYAASPRPRQPPRADESGTVSVLRGRTLGGFELGTTATAHDVPQAEGNQQGSTLDDDDEGYPEGGYGWRAVLGASIVFFFYLGLTYSWGVIQDRLTSEGLAPSSTLAFIGSTAAFVPPLTVILTGRLVKRWGNRVAGMIGCILIGLREILSSFATGSVAGLFVTQGLIFGLGCSFAFNSGSTLPAQYFKRKRGLATGLVYAGGGLGGAVISVSMDYLLNRLGIQWTYRVLGLVVIVGGLPATALLKPRNKDTGYVAIVEWSLFKDLRFSILIVMGFLATFPLFVPPFFIPLYATSIGLSTGTGAALLAGWNLGSAFGRLSFGALADSKLLGPRRTAPLLSLLIALSLTGVSMLALWTVSSSLAPLILFSLLNGAGAGGFFSLMPTILGSIFGSSKVATALGMIVTSWTFGYFMGAPVAGYLLDAYGGPSAGIQAYRPAMYYAGSVSLASAVLVATVAVLVRTGGNRQSCQLLLRLERTVVYEMKIRVLLFLN